MTSELFVKGWFLIVAAVSESGGTSYLLHEPIRNVQLAVTLPTRRQLGLPSAGYAFQEGQYVRLQTWAKCTEAQGTGIQSARTFICNAEPEELKELPCKPDEGMWMAGIQYC